MFELRLNAYPLEKDWTNMILRAGQGLAKGWPRAGQGAPTSKIFLAGDYPRVGDCLKKIFFDQTILKFFFS